MAKLAMLVGLGAGYVLGARAGRERYDQMMGKAQQLWRDPRVQRRASQAQDVVQDRASHAAGAVKDVVNDKVPGLGSDGSDVRSTEGAVSGAGASGSVAPTP